MDDDLRGLEQRFAAGPTPQARLSLARALERAGRRDDAQALLAGDAFAMAAALEGFPAWTHPDGDPGRARWLDVAPVARAPRPRWRAALGLQPVGVVVACAWGVVVHCVAPDGHGRALLVLDPDTGDVRLWREETLEVLAVVEGVLLAVHHGPGAARDLVAWDLATGHDAWRLALGGNPSPGHARGALVLGAADDARLAFVPLPDPRRAPTLPEAWPDVRVSALTRERAYVHERRRAADGRTWVARLAGGAVADVAPWPGGPGALRADDAGVLTSARGAAREVALCAPDGEARWRVDRPGFDGDVLAPGHVALSRRRDQVGLVLARADGRQVGDDLPCTTLAGARDWLYAAAGERLVARRFDDEDRWEVRVEGPVDAVLPLPGRLVALTLDGAALCFEST